MPLRLEESTLAGAPTETVWRLVADPTCWRLWWPACLEAAARDRKPLHDGSELRLVVKPSWIPIRFALRVEVATAPRALILAGRGAGLEIRHSFFLEARPNGTLVRERQELSGWGLAPFRLLRQDVASGARLRENLKGLKRLAERSL